MGNWLTNSAPRFGWDIREKRTKSSSGGSRSSYTAYGFYLRDPAATFAACGAVALGDASDQGAPGPKEGAMQLPKGGRHASAR